MPVDIQALGIDRMSVGERLELIEQIWNSLPERVDVAEIPTWHLAELGKRRQDVDQHPRVGKPWREVLGSLESEP
jgi:putative addiction module component (TIGR02574 family)